MQQRTLNAATAKFQLALPVVLSPISPHLAALHATRVRLLYPGDNLLAGTHCTRCGTPFLSTGGSIRSVRKNPRKNSSARSHVSLRVLRRSCRACGFDDDVPIDSANPPVFPKVRDRARRNSSSAAPRAFGTAPATPAAVPASAQHAPLSQPHAPRSLQSPATPASSRSASIASASSSSRPSPAPVPAPIPPGSSAKSVQGVPTSHQPSAAQAKSRPKKKTGLQTLLARNREKQEQEKKRAEGQGQGGLSAFLQGL
ncbi:hypothetical protein BN946_scf184858.g9 [Trametes cinnabarina]|uniref:Uncharacterized protein n=1 Tax=Pycnoporus cinnabarinus TaxID=5643 RepID=A0A060STK7_PYCCI|nr:hypothetical protein BN946_scf184858.g9 [Trametes cinnabarina]